MLGRLSAIGLNKLNGIESFRSLRARICEAGLGAGREFANEPANEHDG